MCLNTVGPPIKKHFETMVRISEGFLFVICSCRFSLSNYFVRQMYGDCFALSAGMVFNDIRLAAMQSGNRWMGAFNVFNVVEIR